MNSSPRHFPPTRFTLPSNKTPLSAIHVVNSTTTYPWPTRPFPPWPCRVRAGPMPRVSRLVHTVTRVSRPLRRTDPSPPRRPCVPMNCFAVGGVCGRTFRGQNHSTRFPWHNPSVECLMPMAAVWRRLPCRNRVARPTQPAHRGHITVEHRGEESNNNNKTDGPI